MFRRQVSLVVLSFVQLAYGELLPLATPQRGFEQNLGQYSSEVLFALDQRILYRDRVQLTDGLSMKFIDANPSPAVTGRNPRAFSLNLYFGNDPKLWRENVPHFATVRYAQVYPGIDIELNADWVPGGGSPAVRIIVAPGANPQQLGISFLTDPPRNWTVFPLDNLAAYQTAADVRRAVPVRFVQINENSFRPQVDSYDSSVPLTIEFGNPFVSALFQTNVNIESDNSVISTGYVFYQEPRPNFLARTRSDGTPVFLSLLSGMSSGWLMSDRQGITLVGGLDPALGNVPPAPVTPDAPRSTPNSSRDGWLGRFDSNGKFLSATYAGDPVNAFTLDPAGGAYFSTAGAVTKWLPGQSQFAFVAPIKNVVALATNPAGDLAFAATGSAGLYTTVGAFQSSYQGPWTEYAGRLDPASGAIRMATYVAVNGSGANPYHTQTLLATAPNGSLWLASQFLFHPGGTAQTLVAVSGDGTQVLDSESLPYIPAIAFDTDGNVLLAANTDLPNWPTSLDARLRVPCLTYGLYLSKRSAADGSLLGATYLNSAAQILVFDGLDRLFLMQDRIPIGALRIDTGRPLQPEIACVISPATRQSLSSLAPDELVTISGDLLGPLQPAYATLNASGGLPLQLAGVEVLLNQVAMPLVSVQQGMITFYVPGDTLNGGFVPLEVRSGGATIANLWTTVDVRPRFAVLTADGSGRGLAAALNQNGTLNSGQGAPPDTVVAIFGIGTTPPSRVYVGVDPVTVEYAGPAPGLVPGVKQINLRMPKSISIPAGSDLVQLSILPGPPNSWPVFIRWAR
jgi:uncharacterized protein (TIGR03437 family)